MRHGHLQIFIETDMMLEATILAEKELANANLEEEQENATINERNENTEAIDTMVEDEIDTQSLSQTLNRLSNAEMFYLGCTLKNP